MKNRKMLLLVLVSTVLVFSLIPSVSTARTSATLHLPDDRSITHSVMYGSSFALAMVLNTPAGNVTPIVAASLKVELGKWDLVRALPRPGCLLTISSTADSEVIGSGEGNFVCNARTVMNLMAGPEEGYQFVGCTGDVDTTMDDGYPLEANFVGFKAGDLGIKTGDWIKFEYSFTGLPVGQPYLEWLKLEFLSVEGTNASVRVTMHISDGTEQSDTVPFDLAAGGGERLAGFVIPANLTIGDSVYMTGYGNVTIEGETTRPYAGVRRTVVYTSFSQDEIQFNYYWDKQTGVMMEAEGSMPSFGYNITFAAKVTETNMWEAAATRTPWWLWAIVAIAIAAVGFTVYRLKKRKTPTTLTEST